MSQIPENPSIEEDCFRSIAHVTLDGILVIDENALICYCNEIANSFFSLSDRIIVGESIYSLFSDHPNRELCSEIQCYLNNKKTWDIGLHKNFQTQLEDTGITLVDLTLHPVNWGSRPLFLAKLSNSIRMHKEVAGDITLGNEAEKKNQLFHQKLRSIVEGCAIAYNDSLFFHSLVKNLATTLQVRCVFVSEFTGVEKAKTLAFWANNDFKENIEYSLKDTPCENIANKTVQYYPKNLQILFPRDALLSEWGVNSYMSLPFFDAVGKPLGHMGIMCAEPLKDPEIAQTILKIFSQYAGSTLERKRIADTLQTSYHRLEASNEELRDFVHIASHDLQEPLRKIISFGDLLKWSSNTLDDEGTYFLERMKSSTRRLQSLLNDLVKFSTLDSSINALMDKVNLTDTAQQVLADLDILISRSNATIEIGQLPVIEGNSFHLLRLFQNLIGNAIKYGRDDTAPFIKIFETASQKGKYCEINFQDNGIGFDEKYLDRIFKPFQRLHRHDQFKGTGMGLAICKKIVERHNGTISAKSKPKEGTTFTVKLPRKQIRENNAQ